MTLEDLYRLMRTGHVQAQGVVDTMTQPVVVLDRSLSVLTANNAFIKTFLVERDDVIGENFFDLGNGQWDIPELRDLIRSVIPKSAAVIGFEVQHDFPSIGQRTFLVDARRLVHPDDNSSQTLVAFEDVTERARRDQEKDFIIAETRHRIRNLSSVLRILAMQTPTQGVTAEQYRDSFLGRLDVTMRAQEIAAYGKETSLQTLIEQAVGETGAGRLKTTGPAVTVDSAKVVTLSMIFHELATNAAKYGALSVADGNIHVEWSLKPGPKDRNYLTCEWREIGGPKVAPPTRSGYGTKLIERTAAHLRGTSELTYGSDGLTATIKIPM
ncbi:UNVERIFIED_ORG: two-component sensor histidine kinase [Shinella zoogloeoides]|nr:two-component sensor histidine kinase [Shinella zoogloeoides]